MKTFIYLLCFLFFISSLSCAYDKLEIEITEVPYRETYAFLGTSFKLGGAPGVSLPDFEDIAKYTAEEIGFSVYMMSARDDRDLQFLTVIGYSKIDVEEMHITNLDSINCLDIMIGGKYFPRYPTFSLSKMPVRLTLSGVGGLGMIMEGTMGLAMEFKLGLVFSSKDNPSGFTLEVGYRPSFKFDYEPDYVSENAISIKTGSAVFFSAGFLFAP